MSAMDEVKEAAEFLDRYCEYDWRRKVNISTLNMYDGQFCVLGQVYGDFGDGRNILREVAGSDEFYVVGGAFDGYTKEWKEYLSMNTTGVTVGSEWIYKSNKDIGVTVENVFRDTKGVAHVVTRSTSSTEYMNVYTEAVFLDQYKQPVKYVEGQLYRAKNNKDRMVLMYSAKIYSNGPGFYFLNDNTYCSVDWFESTYGELIPIQAVNNSDKPVIAKIG